MMNLLAALSCFAAAYIDAIAAGMYLMAHDDPPAYTMLVSGLLFLTAGTFYIRNYSK